MGKYKENPKYNVVSIRVSDAEKALLNEISQRDRTSITDLMRKAITDYTLFREVRANHG
jgi:predicted transcriptional regulator